MGASKQFVGRLSVDLVTKVVVFDLSFFVSAIATTSFILLMVQMPSILVDVGTLFTPVGMYISQVLQVP